MSYRINGNTVISTGDGSLASANASFRNFFYRNGLNPATYPGTVGGSYGYITGGQTNLPTGTLSPSGPTISIRFPLYFAAPAVSPNFTTTSVERFPFAAYVNSVVVGGNLSTVRSAFASQSSKTAGYSSGGYLPIPAPLVPTTPANAFFTNYTSSTVIDSFPFVSLGIISVSSAGSLSQARFGCSGHQSDTTGFTSAGSTSNTTQVATIDSFPFGSFTTATNVGNLGARTGLAGHSSPVSGYTSGGFIPITFGPSGQGGTLGTALTTVSRFPFSAPVTTSSVATLTTGRGYVAGGSSLTNGYTFGGFIPSAGTPQIGPFGAQITSVERFNFSEQTVTVSAVPAVLTTSRGGHSVVSGSEYGYVCGGYNVESYQWSNPGLSSPTNPAPATALQTIDVFPFASTTTTAGTISMSTARGNVGGNQY